MPDSDSLWTPRQPVRLVIAVVSGYLLFGKMLRSGSGIDAVAGQLFRYNLPILCLWIVAVWRSMKFSFVFPVLAAGVQVYVHFAVLHFIKTDPRILSKPWQVNHASINLVDGLVILIFLALAAKSWKDWKHCSSD